MTPFCQQHHPRQKSGPDGGSFLHSWAALPRPGVSCVCLGGVDSTSRDELCSLRETGSWLLVCTDTASLWGSLGPPAHCGYQLAVSLLGLEPAWSHARMGTALHGCEFVSRGPSLTPSLSASPVLAFPASLVGCNSIWRLIYLHNRYRVPSMCQALARSWGTTNPTVGLSVSLDGREKWKGSLPTHMYIHTYT